MTEITYNTGCLTVKNSQETIQIRLSDLLMNDRNALRDTVKFLNINIGKY